MMKLQTLAARAAGVALTGVAFVLVIGGFDTNHAAARGADVDADLLNDARRNFQPLPKDMATPEFPITPSRVELGWKLFFDPRISVDGTTSCARCHQPALYGTADIVAFLGSLTGKLPQGFVDAPILPASGVDVSQPEAPQQQR